MVDTEKPGAAIDPFSRPIAPSTPPTLASHRVTFALGTYLLAVVAVLFYSLITLWVQADAKGLYPDGSQSHPAMLEVRPA